MLEADYMVLLRMVLRTAVCHTDFTLGGEKSVQWHVIARRDKIVTHVILPARYDCQTQRAAVKTKSKRERMDKAVEQLYRTSGALRARPLRELSGK